MKKALSLLLCLLLLLSMNSINAYASTSMSDNIIYSSEIYAEADGAVEVPIRMQNNKGFMGFSIIFNYDSSVLEPISVQTGEVLSGGMLNDSIGYSNEGTVKVVYNASENKTSDGVLFYITFKIRESVSDNTVLNVSYLKSDTFNERWEDVLFNCNDIVLHLCNTELPENPGTDPNIPSEDETKTTVYSDMNIMSKDKTIDIPVYIKNNFGIMGYKLFFDFDDDVLKLNSIFPPEINGNFDYNLSNDGKKISVVWNSSENYCKDGLLFKIRFDVLKYSNSIVHVGYSSSDTFNDEWMDVALECKDIVILKENPEADYSSLDSLIDHLYELDPDIYTNYDEIYWQYIFDFVEDYVPSHRYYKSDNQDQVDAMTDELQSYIDMLILKRADYTVLNTKIYLAQNEIAKGYYTQESVASLQSILDKVEYDCDIFHQMQVDSYVADIQSGIDALIIAEADYSSLDSLIDYLYELDPDNYTNYDEIYWQYIFDFVEDYVPSHHYYKADNQDQVNAMADELQSYIDLLEIKEAHVHSGLVWNMVLNPTVTHDGLAEKRCDVCGELIDSFVIPHLIPDYTTGITLSSNKETVGVGDRFILTAKIMPDTSKNKNIIWYSLDTRIAKVDNGKVTALKPGSTVIVAQTEDETIKDFCFVRVISLTPLNGAEISYENNIISGLCAHPDNIYDYIRIVDDSMSIMLDTSSVGTGTTINVVDNGDIIDSYDVVIFGDVNGDGWYDGMDSMIVSCLANGMLKKEDVSEAVYMAADCNHDGSIDQLDVDILQQAGVLLSQVDQSKSEEELLETSSAYVEYLNLIDQTVDTENKTETGNTNEPANPVVNLFCSIINFFKDIITLIKSMVIFVKAGYPSFSFTK